MVLSGHDTGEAALETISQVHFHTKVAPCGAIAAPHGVLAVTCGFWLRLVGLAAQGGVNYRVLGGAMVSAQAP